jgi:hypothetical protein
MAAISRHLAFKVEVELMLRLTASWLVCRGVKILLGRYVFADETDLWREDGSAGCNS